jgi:hypothetical protein
MPFIITPTEGKQGIPGTAGANGAAGTTPFTLVGAYNNGADYTYGDAVYYQGGTYVRTGNPNNPGYPPSVGGADMSWTPLAEKGAEGENGINLVSVPLTNTSTGTVGQIASDATHLYVCVGTNSWVRINKDNW